MLNMRNSTINVTIARISATITRVSATIIRITTEYIRNNSRKNRVSILFRPVPVFGRYAHGTGFKFISGMFCLWWVVVDVRAKGSDFGTPRGDTPAARTMQAPGAGKCWHIRRIISAERKRGEMVQVFSGSRLFGGCSSRSRSPELGG